MSRKPCLVSKFKNIFSNISQKSIEIFGEQNPFTT